VKIGQKFRYFVKRNQRDYQAILSMIDRESDAAAANSHRITGALSVGPRTPVLHRLKTP